jgi:hypothetical protein
MQLEIATPFVHPARKAGWSASFRERRKSEVLQKGEAHTIYMNHVDSDRYIKELADRVSSLEGQLRHDGPTGASVGDAAILALQVEFAPPPAPTPRSVRQMITKRPRDDTEDDQYTESVERTGFPPQSPSDESYSSTFLDFYYSSIHSVFPFLPNQPSQCMDYRTAMPNATRDAFDAIPKLTLQTRRAGETNITALQEAHELLNTATMADSHSLYHVQTLLLLYFEANQQGVQTLQGRQGPTPKMYLHQAIETAKLAGIFQPDGSKSERELDALQQSLMRPTVITLWILDAFENIGGRLPNGPITSMNPILQSPVDHERYGNRLYRLSRLTTILGRLCQTSLVSPSADGAVEAASSRFGLPRGFVFADDADALQEYRDTLLYNLEEFPLNSGMKEDYVLNLAFWYTWLAAEAWLAPIARGETLFLAAKMIVDGLPGYLVVVRGENGAQGALSIHSPLTAHFSGIAAHVLVQLAQTQEFQGRALQMLGLLEVVLDDHFGAMDAVLGESYPSILQNEESLDVAVKNYVSGYLRSKGSTGESNGDHDAMEIDQNDLSAIEVDPIALAVAAATSAVSNATAAAQMDSGELETGGDALTDEDLVGTNLEKSQMEKIQAAAMAAAHAAVATAMGMRGSSAPVNQQADQGPAEQVHMAAQRPSPKSKTQAGQVLGERSRSELPKFSGNDLSREGYLMAIIQALKDGRW